jgi:hypothetical protein
LRKIILWKTFTLAMVVPMGLCFAAPTVQAADKPNVDELKRLTSVAIDIDRNAAIHNCAFALSLDDQAKR